MKPESYKPDISNLVRNGHFYFGWTQILTALTAGRMSIRLTFTQFKREGETYPCDDEKASWLAVWSSFTD